MSHHHHHHQHQDDALIVKLESGVAHLQAIVNQVHSLSNNGSVGNEISEVFNAVDQIRQDRDVAQAEIARLRHENVAVHQSLRALLRIIERFSSVQEPVVASDGYTYERKDLLKYFDDCKKTEAPARSHLTQEDLDQNILVNNLSMKRMLNLLQEVEVPIIPATTGGSHALAGFPTHLQHNNSNNGSSSLNKNHNGSTSSIPSSTNNNNGNGVASNNNNNTENNNVIGNGNNNSNNNLGGGRISPSAAFGSNNNNNQNNSGEVSTWETNGVIPQQNTFPVGGNNSYNRDRRRSSTEVGSKGSRGSRRASLQSPVQFTGQLHPCLRVYGKCKFENQCVFANYPFECCLSFLKGKCRFGNGCLEPHIEFRGDSSNNNNNNNGAGFLRSESGEYTNNGNNSNSHPNSRRPSLQQNQQHQSPQQIQQ